MYAFFRCGLDVPWLSLAKPAQTMTGKDVRTALFAGQVAGDSKVRYVFL